MSNKLFLAVILSLSLPPLAAAQTTKYLPDAHPKAKTALKVYDHLKPFISRHNQPFPGLELVQSRLLPKPASYDAAKNCIYVEEKAFDACASLGKDSLAALAALIAHEAIHFFKQHGGERDFACAFFEADGGLDESREKQETEADLWGLFIAYLAGYEVEEIASRMLDVLYKNYNLSAEIPGYPTLEERKQTLARSLEKWRDLTALFEAGNYLVVLGEHDQAAACYRTILADYQSPEMYNNLGVALASYVVSRLDASPVYPFEVDVQSRLYRKPRSLGFEPQDLKKYWLPEAEKALEEALLRKRDYVAAHINLAIVRSLQDRPGEARSLLAQARQLPRSGFQDHDLAVLEAIIEWQDGNADLAKTILLAQGESAYALENLHFFEKGISPQSQPPDFAAPLEQPCAEKLPLRWDTAKIIALKKGMFPDFAYELAYKNSACSAFFMLARKGSDERVYLQKTKQDPAFYGSAYAAVRERFGDRLCQEVHAPKNTFTVCCQQGLFFRFDQAGRVDEWGIFRVK